MKILSGNKWSRQCWLIHSPLCLSLNNHSANLILFTAQHVKSQVISQQQFNLQESAHTSIAFTVSQAEPFKLFSLDGCRAVNTLRNSIPISWRHAVLREEKNLINSPNMFAFFWLCLIWNSHSSVEKLREGGVMAAWDAVSLNIWLAQGGFYLWLKVNTVSLPGTGGLAGAVPELDGEGGEQIRRALWNSEPIQVSWLSPAAFVG